MLKTYLEKGIVDEKKMKQTKTLYSFSNCRYELLNLYQKILKPKKSRFVCSRIFFFFILAQFIVRPNFNIIGNRLNFLSTTMHKLRDLLQQTDLKHLNLSGRYKCSKNKGHFLF